MNLPLNRRLVDENGYFVGHPGGTTPITSNITMTTANTEYTASLPTGVRSFDMKLRAANDFKVNIGSTASLSSSSYMTIAAGGSYGKEGIFTTGSTELHFQAATASQTMELIYWT